MSVGRVSLSLAGVVGAVALTVAGATIWLFITQPVKTANMVAEGEVSPVVRALADVVYGALQGILKYL
jgi:hypothetical protein